MSQDTVGPGKPPKEHRFKKGNQAWKKREEKRRLRLETRSYVDDFREVMAAPVPVRRNGRLTYESRLQVLVSKLVHEAMKGDVSSADLLLNLHADSMTIGDLKRTVLVFDQPGDDTD